MAKPLDPFDISDASEYVKTLALRQDKVDQAVEVAQQHITAVALEDADHGAQIASLFNTTHAIVDHQMETTKHLRDIRGTVDACFAQLQMLNKAVGEDHLNSAYAAGSMVDLHGALLRLRRLVLDVSAVLCFSLLSMAVVLYLSLN